MSLRATLWAYDDAPVENATEVLVLIALADEAADDGVNAFPSIRKIAARARVKKRAAQYALRKLETAGVIVKGNQAAAAKHIARADRRPTVYDLNMGMTWETVGKRRPGTEDDAEEPDGDGVQILHPASRGAISEPDGVQSEDTRGAIPRTHGVHAGAPDPTVDPTKDPTKDPAASADASTQQIAEAASRLSEEWWEYYQATFGKIMRSGKSNPFIALRDNIVTPALAAEWTETEIKWALRGPSSQTPDAVPAKGVFQKRLAEVRHGTRRDDPKSNVHHLPASDPDQQRRAGYFATGS